MWSAFWSVFYFQRWPYLPMLTLGNSTNTKVYLWYTIAYCVTILFLLFQSSWYLALCLFTFNKLDFFLLEFLVKRQKSLTWDLITTLVLVSALDHVLKQQKAVSKNVVSEVQAQEVKQVKFDFVYISLISLGLIEVEGVSLYHFVCYRGNIMYKRSIIRGN